MKRKYILISQGIEIYYTTDKKEAERIMNESNKAWYKYRQECYDTGEKPVDNEMFMYEECI